jgi:hypothetical protein
MMSVTFAFGIGIHRLIWQRQVNKTPSPKAETISFVLPEPYGLVPTTVPAVAPAPVATPTPNFIRDYDSEKFALYAVFYPMGPTPEAFADVESIEVAPNGDGEDDPGYITVNTRLYDKYYNAEATFALVTERRLFFVTSKARDMDFEYRFDGEFLRTDFDAMAGKNKAVLRGTLTRTRNGRKIAEHTFNFRVGHLGC